MPELGLPEFSPFYIHIMIVCNCFFMYYLFHSQNPASFNAEKPVCLCTTLGRYRNCKVHKARACWKRENEFMVMLIYFCHEISDSVTAPAQNFYLNPCKSPRKKHDISWVFDLKFQALICRSGESWELQSQWQLCSEGKNAKTLNMQICMYISQILNSYS